MSEAGNRQDSPPSNIEPFATVSFPGGFVESSGEIGPYKLLRILGEGGFGVVYLAEQREPVNRQVALKIIKPGMDTKQVIARFEAERQTLALLDHPNIAYVLDAGTTQHGRPYFVMEYVKGVPITEYCDQERLSIEDRLHLFSQVCDAIQYAHQKGIIHRDIKPSNILIKTETKKPVPKVIDFGVSKAIAQHLTEKTLFTEQGQLVGTPTYMSPEQAEMTNQDIDTRSDIYSLGVLLYELLTGALPFDPSALRRVAIGEIQRIIREEEPPRPSTKLSSLGEEATKVAQQRSTQVVSLTRRLQKELEWIPLKAMRKERTRRYRSASELGDDIQNYLSGAPLIAGPESAVYRIKKFVRRNRASVTGIVAVAAVLAIGLVVSTAMYFRAENARIRESAAHMEKERINYFNTIALAEAEYDRNHVRRARHLLVSCPAEMRGWEWYRLILLSYHKLQMILQGHVGNVNSISITPDGRRIVSGSEDGTVKIWDMASGIEVRTLTGHSGPVLAVCVSPDGRRIVSGSRDGMAKLWDAESGVELATMSGHDRMVCSVAFSLDGMKIASGSIDQTVRIWDAANPIKPLNVLQHESPVYTIAFSPDGKRIAVGGEGSVIAVWDIQQSTKVKIFEGHKHNVNSICYMPSGDRIVSGSFDGTAKIWDVENGAEVLTFSGHIPQFKESRYNDWDSAIHSVAVDPKGKHIISAGKDGIIRFWNAEDGTEQMMIAADISSIDCVVFSPDGKHIISGGYEQTIKVWDSATGTELLMLLNGDELGWSALPVFSPDSSLIAFTGSDLEVIRICDTATAIEVSKLVGHKEAVCAVAFSPDGRHIVSGGEDHMVKIWNIISGIEQTTLHGHEGAVRSVAFSLNGKKIVSSDENGIAKIWDALSGKCLMDIHHYLTGYSRVFSFSPDGKYILLVGEDGFMRIWNAETGSERLALEARSDEDEIFCAVFSPDGRLMASGSSEGTVRIWDTSTWANVKTLFGHASEVSSVAFDPKGQRIVSGSLSGDIKLWDVASGTEIMTLHSSSIWMPIAIFSPDGEKILLADINGTIRIWHSADPADVQTMIQTGSDSYWETGTPDFGWLNR